MQHNELVQQWTELNKTAMEAIKELGEINTNAMTKLTQRQMEMVSLYMEGSAKQLEALSQAKGVPDLISAQSGLFAQLNEKLMANAQQTMDVLAAVKQDLTDWVEKGMKTASANSSALVGKAAAKK
jgi:phasin family protein